MAHETLEQTEHTVGLVLGRFQPLHPGHLRLIDVAVQECDETVVCIGSAQRAEPFTIAQRHLLLERQMRLLYPQNNWRLVDLVDPEPMEIWPEYVAEQCAVQGTNNRFYRADLLSGDEEIALQVLGFTMRYIDRSPFYYPFPDGLCRLVSSATEIKEVYAELDMSIPYSLNS